MSEAITIRHIRRQMTRLLLAFSLGSIVVGVIILAAVETPWARAIGWQCVVWGAIDLIFALMGVRQSRQADRGEADDLAEAARLKKTLRISDKTNWVWMMLGLAMIVVGMRNPVIVGHGIGVLIQGGFLLFYDRVYLYRMQQVGVMA